MRSACIRHVNLCTSKHLIIARINSFIRISVDLYCQIIVHYGFQSNLPCIELLGVNTLSVADLHNKNLDPPLGVQFYFFFWGGEFGLIIGWRPPPPLRGCRPSGKSWIRHWLSQIYLKISLIVSIIDGLIRESSSNLTSLHMAILKPWSLVCNSWLKPMTRIQD